MPAVLKNRPGTGVYGSRKLPDEKRQNFSSLNKHNDVVSYNAHSHFIKKGSANRSILKTKMEIRTNSDSNDNEYNLILKNDKSSIVKHINGNIIFSPSEKSSIAHGQFPHSNEKSSQKSNSLQSHGKIKQKHIGVFSSQENIWKKFISRNDPYQNALSAKTVIRNASEKRVNNNSKFIACVIHNYSCQYISIF